MNGGVGGRGGIDDFDDDIDAMDDVEDTIVTDDIDDDDDTDNIGDLSVEINVEELVAKLEATDSDDVARRREIRRRLEELREQRDAEAELDSTYNFNLDDDL